MNTGLDALKWMENEQAITTTKLLFRGQNKIWPTIMPSLVRDDEQTITDMYQLCHWFLRVANGITGYCIEKEHDKLAILQHYIGRSPSIDLTGTPIIALYFALLNANVGDKCVVYSIDSTTKANVVISNHDFLIRPLEDGGKKHRWLRQDGYTISPNNWRDLSEVKKFDLLKLEGIKTFEFIKHKDDDKRIIQLGDLEEITSDPLAYEVTGAVEAALYSLQLNSQGVLEILDNAKILSPMEQIKKEIDFLLQKSKSYEFPEKIIVTLKNLKNSANKNSWDMSFDVGFSWAKSEIIKICSVFDGKDNELDIIEE